MSYCRFNGGRNDVYVYRSDGYVCMLRQHGPAKMFECASASGMVDHLELLRLQGHKIPQHALDRLRKEI